MTISQILNETHHRPWKIPGDNWKYYQEWNDVIFLHWQVDYDLLRSWVPEVLEIDLFEGVPWVSLVAFTMEKVRTRNLPSFKPISCFDEVNIRTYLRSGEKTGVYFLSIEGGKRISCQIARTLTKMPYRYSAMKRTSDQYNSSNAIMGDALELQFQTGESLPAKTDLDRWLTERYALFQDAGTKIYEYEVHHIEWPVMNVELEKMNIHYPRFKKLIGRPPDKVHYSKGVEVVAWDALIW